MSAAITQAKLAMGLTSPNPPVGAIIVSEENKIIGMGNTQPYGKNHAEIEAIKSAGNNVKNSTLYTTLEPCNIELNTPPCTKSIIQNNIKHVIIGTKDPNPKINGKGINLMGSGVKQLFQITHKKASFPHSRSGSEHKFQAIHIQ